MQQIASCLAMIEYTKEEESPIQWTKLPGELEPAKQNTMGWRGGNAKVELMIKEGIY